MTCPAAPSLVHVHARQPAVVPAQAHDEWLDDTTSAARRLALVQVPHTGPYCVRAVSMLVNSPRNDTPEVLREFAPE